MHRLVAILTFTILSWGGLPVWADTVVFKDGTEVNGKIHELNAHSIALETGGGRMVIQRSELLRTETNDLMGSGDRFQHMRSRAELREAALTKRTGLDKEQRARVRGLIRPLQSTNPAEQAEAIKALVAMDKEVGIYNYLLGYLPHLSDRFAPGVLEAMVGMDPERAAATVRAQTASPRFVQRAKAVELMGRMKDTAHLDTIARGMLDPSSTVQVAAAEGLGYAADQRATPVLIEGLSSADRRLQNASRRALSRIWSTDQSVLDFGSREEWERFWQDRRHGVTGAIDPATLKPLVAPIRENVSRQHE